MTVENLGDATWLVQMSKNEAAQMGCTGDNAGSALADKAVELTGCTKRCTAQIYYGREELLLFLREEPFGAAYVQFEELEALLGAASCCRAAEDTSLYALPQGYLLRFGDLKNIPLQVWDFGKRMPQSAAREAKLLIEKDAAPFLCRTFSL